MGNNLRLTSDWFPAYASVAGKGHIRDGVPCQDSSAYAALANGWQLAIVCDGAGSSTHSHEGSALVVKGIVQRLQAHTFTQSTELPSAEIWRSAIVEILRQVRDELAAYAEQAARAIKEYSSTVVLALFRREGALVAHIGDGRGAYRTEKAGEWLPLFTPFRGEEANETIFIASDIWGDEASTNAFVASSILQAPITALALTSDGCEKGSFLVNVFDEESQKYHDPNLPFAPFFEPNARGVRQLHKEGKTQEEINAFWSSYLDEGHRQFKTETDDKSLVLVVHQSAFG